MKTVGDKLESFVITGVNYNIVRKHFDNCKHKGKNKC